MRAATINENETDRVRRHSPPAANQAIDQKIRERVREAVDLNALRSRRITELETEWDMERTLNTNAATLALTGAVLGTTVSKKWFWLTGAVLGFLFQHAVRGWCPPLPLLRKLGVRTQNEIDREKYALKAIRGDFSDSAGQHPSVERALQSVMATESSNGFGRQREPDRVRRYTSRELLRRLDASMETRVRLYASQPRELIDQRVAELRHEWSIERYLQINVAAVGVTTAALATTSNRNWGIATIAALGFFLFHAVEGFAPPTPVLRRMGIRSRAEINREIYALKILRGDFDEAIAAADEASRVEPALTAVTI